LAPKSARATIGSEDVRTTLGDQGGEVKPTTLAGYALIAFVAWWIIKEPGSAAHLVTNIGNFLSSAASGVSHFVSSI
jgi:hypothetical protein